MSARSESARCVARAEVRTSAAPEAAYAAWADPAKLAQWFVDRARGEAHAGASMTWVWEAFGMEAEYRVLEADPPHRLVLSSSGQTAPPGVIEITIVRARGETVITVVNSGFGEGPEWDEMYEGVRSGWELTLGLSRVYLERYFGRPKRSFLQMQPADVD
ncbi:MAG: SRPBCC family protein, partial [Gemmatimonadales bacterium]